MNTADLKVGDSVYFRSHVRYMHSKTVTVTKVGRKYVYIDGDLQIERGKSSIFSSGTGSALGRIYADEATCEAEVVRQQRWSAMRRELRDRYEVPSHLTDEDLEALERILKVDAQAP